MNLIIDFGNSLAKIYVFDQEKKLIHSSFFKYNKNIDNETVRLILRKFKIVNAIISSVINHPNAFNTFIKENCNFFIELSAETPLPIGNLYETKLTLGNDRIAAATGANNIFPSQNVLVVDLGSAITFDMVNSENQFLGGNISPGLEMRFKALHTFTSKLPLVSKNPDYQFIGKNTENAILSGVQSGIVFEIEGYISELEKQLSGLKVILTGGDSIFFEKLLKKSIFVEPNLVATGLNIILNYNVLLETIR